MSDLEQERKEFINSLVPFVCEGGWKESSLQDASKKVFKEELYYKTLFDSVGDVLSYFENLEDEKMVKKFGTRKKEESIRQFIGKLVLSRIREIPGGINMHKALKDYYISFTHIGEVPKSLWRSADRIWIAAGDKSVDMNYYSKRFLLASIYAMSVNRYIKDPESIDSYVPNALDKLVKRMQKLKLPKLEDIPILRLFS